MKKLFLILITFALLFTFSTECYAADKVHSDSYSFHSNTSSFVSQNITFKSSRFADSSSPQDIFNKYRISRKASVSFIIAGGVCSGLGTLFLASGMIMGMMPYATFPDSMKTYDHFIYGDSDIWYVDYPYMTAFASVGISMVLTGALMVLFCMPLLIYGSLALYDYNKFAKQNTVTFNGNGLTIQLDNIGKRRI